jgi:ribosomal protein S18 acetylase RimI-like enzyme
MTPIIRDARRADASALAVLVDIAGEGLPAALWQSWKAPEQTILEYGRERALREEGAFSYRHTLIAECEDEPAACLVGYPLDDPYELSDLEDLPEIVRPMVALEAQAPGSWYVNVLATFPEFRGRGFGAKLLEAADAKGRAANAPAMSVIVGSWNVEAAALYARSGYAARAVERAVLPPGYRHEGDWILMIKSLS